MKGAAEMHAAALIVERNRRLAAHGHDEDVVDVEPVEDPQVVPDDAPHECASRRERRLEVSRPRQWVDASARIAADAAR